MRSIPLALLVVGCGSTSERRSPLLPSEFHLIASHSHFDTGGVIDRRDSPVSYDQDGSGSGYTLGVGFTWDLAPAPRFKRRPYLAPESIPTLIHTSISPAAADHPAAGCDLPSGHHIRIAPDASGGSTLQIPLPSSEEGSLWAPLVGACTMLALAIAAYIKRSLLASVVPWIKRQDNDGPPDPT